MSFNYPVFLTAVILAALATTAGEREETERLATKYQAQTEVRMRDGTRADLANAVQVWEIDYAAKWAEAIGQALHYRDQSHKRGGIIILLRDPAKDWRGLVRAAYAAGRYGLDFDVEEVEDEADTTDAGDLRSGGRQAGRHVPGSPSLRRPSERRNNRSDDSQRGSTADTGDLGN